MSAQSPQWIATARLLRRMGFGATGPRIDAATAAGPPTYIDQALASDPDHPGAASTSMPQFALPGAPPGRRATVAARREC